MGEEKAYNYFLRLNPEHPLVRAVVDFTPTAHSMPTQYFTFWGDMMRVEWVDVPLDGSGVPLALYPDEGDEEE